MWETLLASWSESDDVLLPVALGAVLVLRQLQEEESEKLDVDALRTKMLRAYRPYTTVTVRKDEHGLEVMNCPFCHQVHKHGWGMGERGAHCGRGAYILMPLDDEVWRRNVDEEGKDELRLLT